MSLSDKRGKEMDIVFFVLELAYIVFLFVMAKAPEKKPSNIWRILYAVPVFIAILEIVFDEFNIFHIGVYVAAMLVAATLFTEVGDFLKRRIITGLSAILIVSNLIFILVSPVYNRVDYLKDFENGFESMKEHYILAKEKEIDWDELYAKYEPIFREVNQTQDHVKNYQAWQMFTGEFYDGHVGYLPENDSHMKDAVTRSYGNDFGLSLMKLSSGEFVAVNVEGCGNSYSILSDDKDDMGIYTLRDKYMPAGAENARLTLKDAGIKNGTVITKWNGKPVDEYFDEVTYYMMQYPVRENEEFYLPMYVAGIGKDMEYGETFIPGKKNGEGVSEPKAFITFINDDGEEKTVEAPNLGVYAARMYDTIAKLDEGVNITNLNWQKVDDETYLIRISEMALDQETYMEADYSELTDRLRGEVLALKETGVKNIIFDLRENGGGSPYFVEAIAQIFASLGEHITYYNAVINEETAEYERDADGRYKMGIPSSFEGEDLWHDGQVILLVNAITVSAGDDMTYIMGQCPNVKIMGFTRSNSSCQAVSGVDLENGSLTYSAVPNLFPDGSIAIDTFSDHVGRAPFDEKIPFDENAIESIFDKGEDYLLDYVSKCF